MLPRILLSILVFASAALQAQPAFSDPGGVLHQLTVARFGGSGTQSIQALTSDAAGNVYVAGTTSSFDFPTKNAEQPVMGEAVLMRSLDRGLTWKKVAGPQAMAITVAPHPRDPQTLLVGGADGIYKTTDGGNTWRHVYAWVPLRDAGIFSGAVLNIAFDPANTGSVYVYVLGYAAGSQFLASTDGGESWESRNVSSLYITKDVLSGVSLLWVDPNGSGAVVVGTWISSDGGMTWVSMSQLSASMNFVYTVPDPRHRGWIYAATTFSAGGGLYLSKDWGSMWAQRPAPTSFSADYFLFDPDYAYPVYSVASVFLYVSGDAGLTWRTTSPIDYVSDGIRLATLSRNCGGGALLAPSSGGVASSLDFGLTWQPPQLTRVVDLASGPGCAVYAVRSVASDAFVAKLAPGGKEVLWSTFLGGSDLDSAAAIALDTHGNVYVAGNTASSDFPATEPRVGVHGKQNVFAAKLDSGGKLVYSVVIGGEAMDNASSLAVDAHGDAHIVGWTSSKSFPVTHGAFQTKPGDNDGFAVKLTAGGTVDYASYLPDFGTYNFDVFTINPPQVVAVVAETAGSVLIGGYDGKLSRMNANGSSLTALPNQPGQIFDLESDSQGNIYIAEQVIGPSTGSAPCFQGFYEFDDTAAPGDIFLIKLRANDLQQIYSTRLFGDCKSWPVSVKVGPTGEAAIGMWTLDRFPTRAPALPFSGCGLWGSAVVARLSADGSTVLFSSFLDMCGQGAPIALGADGAIFAAVTPGPHISYAASTAAASCASQGADGRAVRSGGVQFVQRRQWIRHAGSTCRQSSDRISRPDSSIWASVMRGRCQRSWVEPGCCSTARRRKFWRWRLIA